MFPLPTGMMPRVLLIITGPVFTDEVYDDDDEDEDDASASKNVDTTHKDTKNRLLIEAELRL